MSARIRPAGPDDADAFYRVCLLCGDSGGDASALYRDKKLIGHVYAAPYLFCGPAIALAIEDDDGIGGYAVGSTDTRAFEAALERNWWPDLRRLHADPGPPPHDNADAKRAYMIHHPVLVPEAVVEGFPAQMHMNLLPRLQGRGLGKRLAANWLTAAARAGAETVHVSVNPHNARAIAFWQRMGFQPIEVADANAARPALWFGRSIQL